jgi:hypothetical protein
MINGGKKMKFKNIKCLGCGTQESPLFMISPPQHGDDVWCQECKVKEMGKRADVQDI